MKTTTQAISLICIALLAGCQTAPLQTTPGLSSSDLHQQKLNEVLNNGGKRHWWTRGTQATPITLTSDNNIPDSEEQLQHPDRLNYLHAVLQERSGNLKNAAASFEKAYRHNPEMIEAQVGLARVRIAQNNLEDAQKLLMDAHEKQPKAGIVWQGISKLYQSQNESERAIQAMRKAVQYDPNQTAYKTELASLLVSVDQPQLAFEELRHAFSEADSAYFIARVLYESKHDLKQAQQYLNYALSKNPEHAEAQKLVSSVQRDLQYATIASRERSNATIRQVSSTQAAQQ